MNLRLFKLLIGYFVLILSVGMAPHKILVGSSDLGAINLKSLILAGAHEFATKSRHNNEPEAKGFGSGFIISNNGYVLTCYHVIADSRVIKVRFDDNLLSAKMVYKDIDNDLALLKISGTFPALALLTKPTATIGQEVFTIGYPNPILYGANEKLSRGSIISMIGVQDEIHLYQINVPIQPGNSGSPVFDVNGNVIGIVKAMSAKNPFKEWGRSFLQDVNFAINSKYAHTLLDTLPEVSGSLLPACKKDYFDNVLDRVKKSVVMIVGY